MAISVIAISLISGATTDRSVTAASSGSDGLARSILLNRSSLSAEGRRTDCRQLRRAVRWYAGWVRHWAAKMGARNTLRTSRGAEPCPKFLARVLRAKAIAYRARYKAWWAYHWDWAAWLPDKWARIGACETGYGKRPGDWRWNSGTYQGAFGFYHGSWDAFVPSADPKAGPYPSEAWQATPRQQYEVALAIYRRYGLSGWGCRGA